MVNQGVDHEMGYFRYQLVWIEGESENQKNTGGIHAYKGTWRSSVSQWTQMVRVMQSTTSLGSNKGKEFPYSFCWSWSLLLLRTARSPAWWLQDSAHWSCGSLGLWLRITFFGSPGSKDLLKPWATSVSRLTGSLRLSRSNHIDLYLLFP